MSNRVSRRQAGRWAQQDDQQAAQQQPVYAAPPPQPVYAAPAQVASEHGGTDRMLEQLRSLADLKEQGVLSEAEFAEQKARILAE